MHIYFPSVTMFFIRGVNTRNLFDICVYAHLVEIASTDASSMRFVRMIDATAEGGTDS